jgi:histidinol-phosphate aminotransferase
LAQLSAIAGPLPPDAVKINANENPLGPCPEALDAIERFAWDGGRYHYEQTAALRDLLAAQEGLEPEYVEPYPGSSAPLYQSVLALCSPSKPFVTADPGYEAGERAAKFIGARVIRVPLTNRYSHDVRKMATASPSAGLIYLCNPNNPTGTLTSPSDIEWLVENKPKGTTVLVDEAYLHFTNAPACSGLVARDRDVIVLRTFSKLYGMAGLRAGAAFGRPDLLEAIRVFSAGALSVPGVVGAIASLKSKTVVPERRTFIGEVRADVFAFLDKHDFRYVPSVSNHFMLDVNRPGQQVVDALRREKIYIGRVWPCWPTHVRVSIGTQEEMNQFKTALRKVMS